MITLTDNAVQKLQEMMEERPEEERTLRIFTKLGGCSGFSYGLALDAAQPGDQRLQVKGIDVALDPESLELIEGSEIDYVNDFSGQGFRIHNPHAVATCGCGSSFRTATRAGQPGSCD
ncbi:MAG: iron-sulfur cluster assembly accessory protein [Alicyclobacillus sp.]|nr:iron-sulfur cluster assembly accessory protein [Alicyclobacillus sp.]